MKSFASTIARAFHNLDSSNFLCTKLKNFRATTNKNSFFISQKWSWCSSDDVLDSYLDSNSSCIYSLRRIQDNSSFLLPRRRDRSCINMMKYIIFTRLLYVPRIVLLGRTITWLPPSNSMTSEVGAESEAARLKGATTIGAELALTLELRLRLPTCAKPFKVWDKRWEATDNWLVDDECDDVSWLEDMTEVDDSMIIFIFFKRNKKEETESRCWKKKEDILVLPAWD